MKQRILVIWISCEKLSGILHEVIAHKIALESKIQVIQRFHNVEGLQAPSLIWIHV